MSEQEKLWMDELYETSEYQQFVSQLDEERVQHMEKETWNKRVTDAAIALGSDELRKLFGMRRKGNE